MGDFTFYGDESFGPNRADTDAYAVAGYLASVDQWKSFIADWQVFGREEGFAVLHKRLLEFNRDSKNNHDFIWASLSEEEKNTKRDRINTRACQIILKHVLGGVGHAVQKSEWRKSITEHGAKWPELFGKGFYAAGVYGCINLASEMMDSKRRVGMVQYVFERGPEQDEAEQMLKTLYDDSRTRDRFRIAGYSFEDKYNPIFVPLQAGDFLAYESCRQIRDNVLTGRRFTSKDVTGPMRCLLRTNDPRYANVEPYDLPVPHRGAFMDAPKIRRMVADIERMLASGDLIDSGNYYET